MMRKLLPAFACIIFASVIDVVSTTSPSSRPPVSGMFPYVADDRPVDIVDEDPPPDPNKPFWYRALHFDEYTKWSQNSADWNHVIQKMLDNTLIAGGLVSQRFGLNLPVPATQATMMLDLKKHGQQSDWLWHMYRIIFGEGWKADEWKIALDDAVLKFTKKLKILLLVVRKHLDFVERHRRDVVRRESVRRESIRLNKIPSLSETTPAIQNIHDRQYQALVRDVTRVYRLDWLGDRTMPLVAKHFKRVVGQYRSTPKFMLGAVKWNERRVKPKLRAIGYRFFWAHVQSYYMHFGLMSPTWPKQKVASNFMWMFMKNNLVHVIRESLYNVLDEAREIGKLQQRLEEVSDLGKVFGSNPGAEIFHHADSDRFSISRVIV